MVAKIKGKIHQKSETEQIKFGIRAWVLREELGLTWKQVAQRLNVSKATIARWTKKATKELRETRKWI